MEVTGTSNIYIGVVPIVNEVLLKRAKLRLWRRIKQQVWLNYRPDLESNLEIEEWPIIVGARSYDHKIVGYYPPVSTTTLPSTGFETIIGMMFHVGNRKPVSVKLFSTKCTLTITGNITDEKILTIGQYIVTNVLYDYAYDLGHDPNPIYECIYPNSIPPFFLRRTAYRIINKLDPTSYNEELKDEMIVPRVSRVPIYHMNMSILDEGVSGYYEYDRLHVKIKDNKYNYMIKDIVLDDAHFAYCFYNMDTCEWNMEEVHYNDDRIHRIKGKLFPNLNNIKMLDTDNSSQYQLLGKLKVSISVTSLKITIVATNQYLYKIAISDLYEILDSRSKQLYYRVR